MDLRVTQGNLRYVKCHHVKQTTDYVLLRTLLAQFPQRNQH